MHNEGHFLLEANSNPVDPVAFCYLFLLPRPAVVLGLLSRNRKCQLGICARMTWAFIRQNTCRVALLSHREVSNEPLCFVIIGCCKILIYNGVYCNRFMFFCTIWIEKPCMSLNLMFISFYSFQSDFNIMQLVHSFCLLIASFTLLSHDMSSQVIVTFILRAADIVLWVAVGDSDDNLLNLLDLLPEAQWHLFVSKCMPLGVSMEG